MCVELVVQSDSLDTRNVYALPLLKIFFIYQCDNKNYSLPIPGQVKGYVVRAILECGGKRVGNLVYK